MEHMCVRCARLFLQGARTPVRRTRVPQLRSFSSISPTWAKGPIDLSQPLPPHSNNRDQSSALEGSETSSHIDTSRNQQTGPRIRKIFPDPSKPSGAPIPDARLRGRGNVSRTEPQKSSDLQRHRPVRIRKFLLGSPNPLDTQLPGRRVQREGRSSTVDLNRTSGLHQRDKPTPTGSSSSQVEREASLDTDVSIRKAAFGSSQSSPDAYSSQSGLTQVISSSATNQEIADESDTEAEIDPDYPSPLDDFSDEELENLTTEQRSALIHELTVKHDRNCALIENLLDDDAEELTEEEQQNIVNELDLPLPDDAELDFTLIYNSHYASMSPNDLMRQMYLLDQLAENANKITEADKNAIVTSLNLHTGEDGTILDLQERRDALIDAANNADEADDEDTPLVYDQEPTYAPQEMLDKFNEAAGQSIDNLSEEEIIEIAKKLGYVEPDGNVFYPWRGEDPEPQDNSINETDNEVLQRAKEAGFIDEQGNLNFPPEEEILARAQELGIADDQGNLIIPTDEQTAAAEAEAESSGMNAKIAELTSESSTPKEEEEFEDEDEDDERPLTQEEEIQKYFDEVIDPSPIPTTTLPHNPTVPSTEVLREDWPNTPLSPTGLTESVIQKVTFLAQRLPHGHWTPAQIAERFEQGYMVRFASEEEKEIVLKVAADLANARAEKAAEKSGEDIQPEGMEFSSLMEGPQAKEKDGLVDAMVRGSYPVSSTGAEQGKGDKSQGKGQGKFIGGVLKQLANNESYKGDDERKFVERVQALLEKAGVKRAGAGGNQGKK